MGNNASTVSAEYFSNLDANQLRLDHLQRPELNKGTIDFVVSSAKEYHAPPAAPRIVPSFYTPEPPLSPSSLRPPEPMRILFAIDVSREAVQCGLTAAACEAIVGALYGAETSDGKRMDPCFPAKCKIGIITFDDTVHFYDLSVSRSCFSFLIFFITANSFTLAKS